MDVSEREPIEKYKTHSINKHERAGASETHGAQCESRQRSLQHTYTRARDREATKKKSRAQAPIYAHTHTPRRPRRDRHGATEHPADDYRIPNVLSQPISHIIFTHTPIWRVWSLAA